MPKVKALTANQRMNVILKSEIDAHMTLEGVTRYKDLGMYMGGCSPSTACLRMRKLEDMKLYELRELVRKLKITPEELIPAIYETLERRN